MDNTHTYYMIAFLAAVVAITALASFGFICQLMKNPHEVPGKKDIFTRLFFLIAIVAVLAIISVLCITNSLDKSVTGNVVVMLITALGVKKIDDSVSKDN